MFERKKTHHDDSLRLKPALLEEGVGIVDRPL
jgi:hypothetical protein